MGVLESVDLKQKNFPFRKKYEEFYARYEILGPLYGTIRYDKMVDKS
jgi:myosin heavy subunit